MNPFSTLNMSETPNSAPLASILIVDDTPANLRLLSAMLSAQGYEVRKALNGDMALKSVAEDPPDLIVLDIMMPEVNGYEVCQRLKASEATCDIPVIFLSALDEEINKVSAFEVGGVDYITKPVRVQEVLARVNTQLTLRRQQQQLIAQNAKLEREIADRLQAEAALQLLNQDLERRVKARTAELEAANTQLLQLQNDLRQALTQEKELNQLKDAFLHTVSHELRTPLNSILGFLPLVIDGWCDSRSEELDLLGQAHQSSLKLLAIVDNMLEIVNIKRGRISVECQLMELAPCLQEAMAVVANQIEAKGLELHQFFADRQLWVYADPLKLKQVFGHILDNAIKFTDAGKITISTFVEEDTLSSHPVAMTSQAIIRIQDTGVGIHPDVLSKLGQAFMVGDGTTTRSQGGVGLGFAISQAFITLMGGKITLTSEGVGLGSAIEISLMLGESDV
jgi:two-component system, sensor histidine kinase and response regulator